MAGSNAEPDRPAQRYDLYLRAGRARFQLRNGDNGVTLGEDGIGWISDGRMDGAKLSAIAAVHMQSGGDWRNPLSQCIIHFRDGYRLTVTDGNGYGVADSAQAATFDAFVRDLHARLAALPSTSAVFTAGYGEATYHLIMICAFILALIGVGIPVIATLATGEIRLLGVALGAGFLLWPLTRMISANAPRTYDPARPPVL